MDILEQSADYPGQIEILGEGFHLSFPMGELANNTYGDMSRLATTIRDSIQQNVDRGATPENPTEGLQQEGDIYLALERVFARMVMTVDQYGHLGDENSDAAFEYISSVSRVVSELEGVFQNLQMEVVFVHLLHTYGRGAKHHLDFHAYLESIYLARLDAVRGQKTKSPNRTTADYTEEVSPREYVARTIFKSQERPVTRTLVGIAGGKSQAEEPTLGEVSGDSRPPMVVVSLQSPPLEESPTLVRHITELGLGKIENRGGFASPVVDIPPQAPPPQIEHPQDTESMDDLDEPTIATEQDDARDGDPEVEISGPVPKMPPAPALVEPSRQRPSYRPVNPGIFEPPPPSQPSLRSSVLEAVASVVAVEQASPSPAAPESTPAPTAQVEPPVEVKVEKEPAAAPVTPEKMEPIAPPADLRLPSSYHTGPEWKESPQDRAREKTVVTRRPGVDTPAVVTSNTRSRLWKWGLAIGAAAGLAGIFGVVYCGNSQDNDSTTDSSASASASNSLKPGTPDQKLSTSADQKNKPEVQKQSEQGVYRVDTSHPAFAAYLCDIKQATGLVSRVKSSAASAKVHYFTDNIAREQAKGRYKHVLNGTESEQQQKIAIATAFVENALENSSDNPWLVSYFKKQQAGIQAFAETGTWNHSARSVGADKLFSAVSNPEKLSTSASVIGYTFDNNPQTNLPLASVVRSAPTYGRILMQVGEIMKNTTNPDDLAPYDDARALREKVCQEVLKVGQASKDPDTRSGIAYIDKAWCKDECAPDNMLIRALRNPVAVTAETTVVPPVSPAMPPQSVPGNIAPSAPSGTPPVDTPPPAHTRIEPVLDSQTRQATASTKKPGFFSKAASKVKSFFGFGSNESTLAAESVPTSALKQAVAQAQPVMPAAVPAPAPEPAFTKADIPMYSWKETLKQYFWG